MDKGNKVMRLSKWNKGVCFILIIFVLEIKEFKRTKESQDCFVYTFRQVSFQRTGKCKDL